MNSIPWWKKSVVYQIYPKSFQDSNNDGIGDINGIRDRLWYLAKLGIDVIWLNPIYQSPQVDNGYDISNYRAIDAALGSMKDFEKLLAEAHELNIKVILDLVVNHTSDQHPWFKKAASNKDNEFHDYYIWKQGTPEKFPNNWGSSFGGSAWKYQENIAEYYLHLFADQQPDLNWENKQVRAEIYSLMRFWLDKGIDGFRMDVINLISKDPNYPDGPLIQGKSFGNYYIGAANGPRVHEYLQEMNQKVLSHYDIMTVGETPHTTSEEATLYTSINRHELDMVFHFDHMHLDYGKYGKFSDKRFKLQDLKRVLSEWQVKMANANGWNSLYWSNHDQPRAVTRFGVDSENYRVKAAKMLGTVLHMLQGTPYIFEGEELGMTNAKFTDITDYQDLETKNIYKELTEHHNLDSKTVMHYIYLKSRDNARTPMQWNDSEYAGFSEAKPWINLNPNYKNINVKQALNDPDSVFYYYQRLIKLRHTLPIVTTGSYELLEPDNSKVYSYIRSDGKHKLLVMGNFTSEKLKINIPTEFKNAEVLIDNYDSKTDFSEIYPWQARVLMI